MGDKIRFGIIGIGGTIGSTTRILADEKNAELVALADPDSNRRERTLGEIEGVQIFDDYKEMLQQAELDAVCIGLPIWMHAPATRDALECGLHVLCEKPPANSAEEMKPLANETPPTHNNRSRGCGSSEEERALVLNGITMLNAAYRGSRLRFSF